MLFCKVGRKKKSQDASIGLHLVFWDSTGFKELKELSTFCTQTQPFNESITLVNTFGFSWVTFDGVAGRPVEPRTSKSSFHFDQEDLQTVEALRSWAASNDILSLVPTVSLSAVQPKAYFDLTCQLLAKAPIDTTCTLLRVRQLQTSHRLQNPEMTKPYQWGFFWWSASVYFVRLLAKFFHSFLYVLFYLGHILILYFLS